VPDSLHFWAPSREALDLLGVQHYQLEFLLWFGAIYDWIEF